MSKREKEILDYIEKYPSDKVRVAVCDIDGILRGKIMHKKKFTSVVEEGFGFCDVIFGWDAGDALYENADFTGWHTGYPDAGARIDPVTFRKIPWENDMPFFLADFYDEGGGGLSVCPRNLLKKISKQAKDQGFIPCFSQEFEWFNFKETPQSLEDKDFRQPRPITPGLFGYSILRSSYMTNYFNELFDFLLKFEVPLEGLHTETGSGVYEAAIIYSDILEAADRAVLFKTGVKEIAYRNEVVASFMARWSNEYPGCSGHIHQSLWDTTAEKNLFYDESRENHISELMGNYIAGQLYCMPHILPMYAPTVNSYKRLVEGAWAPTTLTWGLDNRTTALRAIMSREKSARLETRVSGSDVNPYLSMSASLASGLYGINKKLDLQLATKGNGYEDKRYGTLPGNLHEATTKMKDSEIAKELFGGEFTQHFVQTREWEWKQYGASVTDWELKRYFEII